MIPAIDLVNIATVGKHRITKKNGALQEQAAQCDQFRKGSKLFFYYGHQMGGTPCGALAELGNKNFRGFREYQSWAPSGDNQSRSLF